MKTREINEAKKESMEKWPKVGIIILNWNGWEDTIECLESIFKNSYPNYRIIIVDNNSTNNSVINIIQWIKKMKISYSIYNEQRIENLNYKNEDDYNKKIILIKVTKNLGYAGGNNIGIRYSLANFFDYSLILNNDVYVNCIFLKEMIYAVKKYNDVGVITGKILSYYSPEMIDCCGCRHKWGIGIEKIGCGEIDKGQYDIEKFIDFVMGCFMLIKNEVFTQIGIFNEDYFLYLEESEFCARVNKKYNILYLPKAIIYHKGGKSSGGNKAPITLYYYNKNLMRFMKNYSNKVEYIFFIFRFSLRNLIKMLFYVFTGKLKSANAILRAYIDFLY